MKIHPMIGREVTVRGYGTLAGLTKRAWVTEVRKRSVTLQFGEENRGTLFGQSAYSLENGRLYGPRPGSNWSGWEIPSAFLEELKTS